MNTATRRQIVLDTETTGLNKVGAHYQGHRVIEIGAVEMVNRRLTGNHFHVYLKPDRLVDPEAYAIHGISDEFLADKPTFADTAKSFLDFIRGTDLIIHNAAFDIGFLDYEFRLLEQNSAKIETFCTITDSLLLARQLFPSKRNNLNALCDRYHIDNSKRTLHGALLDAEILAEVYLAMTGGQTSLSFSMETDQQQQNNKEEIKPIVCPTSALKIIYASTDELATHQALLEEMVKKGKCLWRDSSCNSNLLI